MIRDDSGAKEIVGYYDMIWKNLSTLGASLKAAASKEKLEKDELVVEQERMKRQR